MGAMEGGTIPHMVGGRSALFQLSWSMGPASDHQHRRSMRVNN